MIWWRICGAALLFLLLQPIRAEEGGPPISITSPDTATTFALGTIKSRSLFWNKQELVARVTFTDQQLNLSSANEDQHEFRLPGVIFDSAKGLFSARTAKGEMIPIARLKKTLFIKSIQILPNARVRVIHDRGVVNVILEAISPDDPAMKAPPTGPDGEHKVDINSILP